jgi:hypothetical protein
MANEIIITAGAIAVYIATFITWYKVGSSYSRKVLLTANLFIAVFYTICYAIKGSDPCGPDEWFCFKWYEEILFLFIIHLLLFWGLMVVHLVFIFLENILSRKNKHL